MIAKLLLKKYPIMSHGDMLGTGIRFRLLSNYLIPFDGSGVWQCTGLDKNRCPVYTYRIYRVSDDSSKFDFESNQNSDFFLEQFALLIVQDTESGLLKLLAFSITSYPEFLHLLRSGIPNVTEFCLRLDEIHGTMSYITNSVEPSDTEIDFDSERHSYSAYVDKHFKRKTIKQLKTLQQNSNLDTSMLTGQQTVQ